MLKKISVFFKLYWVHTLVFLLLFGLLVGIFFFALSSYQNFQSLEKFNQRQLAANMGPSFLMLFFAQILGLPLYFGMYFYMMRGGGMGNVKIEKAKTLVRMNDVIGLEEAKKEAQELVKLLKDRAMLKAVGGRIIKGTMMIGPPGCGKTYLAKAIATECGLPLLPTVGSEFVGMFVGQGTARMKSLFKQARALADINGGCIIFIDEIDSFARPRGADMGFGGGRMDMNSTINQFLTEMDGLRNVENNIVILAATNVPEHELDSAIMRAGRFDRKIHVTKPNLKERKQLFDFYLSGYLGFNSDDFPGRTPKKRLELIEELCNKICAYHNTSSTQPLKFHSVEEATNWLNDTLIPYKIIPPNPESKNFPPSINQYLQRIQKLFAKPLQELSEAQLRELNQQNEGKKLKRYIVSILFSYQSKRKIEPKVKYDESIDTDILARKTVWFSPAEVESMVREAGLLALRAGRDTLTMKDLGEAYERVSFGQKSNIVLSSKEKYMTAYHETGHALLYYLIHPTDDVMKATVIPRGRALGYVFARPAEEVHGSSKEDLLAEIKVSIASYVVEKKKFGTTTTGVGGGPGADFFTAMTIAHNMVWNYGMGPSGLIGDFTALTRNQYSSTYLSETMKSKLDEEVQKILQECLRDVEKIINDNWECVVYFSEELYKKEELDYDEIVAIFNKFGLKSAARPV